MHQARAVDRRAALIASLDDPNLDKNYTRLKLVMEIGLPFKPLATMEAYFSWPLLPALLPVSFPGVQSSRDDLVVDIDQEQLINRMRQYFDPKVSNEEIGRASPAAFKSTARFEASKVRQYLVRRGFTEGNVIPHLYCPFDLRWLYWEPETKLLDEKRAEYVQHVFDRNIWLAAVQQSRRGFDPPVVTHRVGSRHLVERGANLFPLWLVPDEENHLRRIS
ncbi:MAG: type ISP restriction/modification enzyme [Pyrinomonadaceae bacterium]